MADWWDARYEWQVVRNKVQEIMHSRAPSSLEGAMTEMERVICLRSACCFGELRGMAKALRGRFVESGLAAGDSRCEDDTLPSGRNFHAKALINAPSAASQASGSAMAHKLLKSFFLRSGR